MSNSHVFIHPSATIGAGTTLGPFSVVLENARIGADCHIGSGVVVHSGTIIGDRVRIDDHAVMGKVPLRSPRSAMTGGAPVSPATVGDDCQIGTAAVLYAGSEVGRRVLVADSATVREQVTIGDETIVGRNVTIENRSSIGARCKIETNAYVCALSTIADDCFVAPEVTLTNDDYLGRSQERFRHHGGPVLETGARVGGNATILPGRRIGRDSLVAAGAVVTHDVPARTIVMGIPAKASGPVPEEELLENQ